MERFKVTLIDLDGRLLPPWVAERLAQERIDLVVHQCETLEDLEQHAGEADAVWLFGSLILKKENLTALHRCGAVIRTGSGTDNLPVQTLTERGVLVANTPEAHSDEVSDHAIGLLFTVVRQIALQDRAVRRGAWDKNRGVPRWHVRGQTLGLVGFGLVARLLTGKLSGFELNVLAYDPYVSSEEMQSYGVKPAALGAVLSTSDFVMLHCRLTDETFHLIGEHELRCMKPEAILINVSRGAVIDEQALVRALTEGWFAAAGLDVLEHEPPDPQSPLLKLDNVVITPHIAGYSDRHEEACWRLSVETIVDLANRRWPRSCVNRSVRPRWELKDDRCPISRRREIERANQQARFRAKGGTLGE